MNKILAAVEGKPAMERIQNPASNVLTFPGLEMQASITMVFPFHH